MMSSSCSALLAYNIVRFFSRHTSYVFRADRYSHQQPPGRPLISCGRWQSSEFLLVVARPRPSLSRRAAVRI
jgi:hypothetical protein